MGAAAAWSLYNGFSEYMGDGTFDVDDDLFTVVLLSSSYTPSASHDTYSDISAAELSTANGYTVGGFNITQTWVRSTATTTFDSNNPSWTASGGSITARYAVLVHIAAGSGVPQTGDKILMYSLLDSDPADVTANDGADFVINISTSGFFDSAPA